MFKKNLEKQSAEKLNEENFVKLVTFKKKKKKLTSVSINFSKSS